VKPDPSISQGADGVIVSRRKHQPSPTASAAPNKRRRRGWWLKQLHGWHWVSAAVSLAGMLLFAATGITLNHAASITATPHVANGKTTLTPDLIRVLRAARPPDAPLPHAVSAYLSPILDLNPGSRPAEWTDGEVYVAMPSAGRDAWISIDRTSGAVTSEVTDRGWISYLNDLHKGRNTGSAWFWFIDVFAVACIIFTITGFLLLQLHARHRPSTWPLVGLSLLGPAAIAIFLIH
jgi:hypothetical protein